MDEDQLFLHPPFAEPPPPAETRPPEDSLKFLMEQLARLPTRRELAMYAFVILAVGAVLGIIATEAFWRYIPKCGPDPTSPLPAAVVR